jgi:hypothetical protein
MHGQTQQPENADDMVAQTAKGTDTETQDTSTKDNRNLTPTKFNASFETSLTGVGMTVFGILIGVLTTIGTTFITNTNWLLLALGILSFLLLSIGCFALSKLYRTLLDTSQAISTSVQEETKRSTEKLDSLTTTRIENFSSLEESYGNIARNLERLYGRISWTQHLEEHDENVFDRMRQLLQEPELIAVDIFTILRNLGKPKAPSSPYYESIDRLLSERQNFSYRRILINRLEPLGHYLASRAPLWKHLKNSASNSSEIRYHHASERRLFDISFGIFYRKSGNSKTPMSLVLEISQWGVAGQIMGLLEIRETREKGLLHSFEQTFGTVWHASRAIDLDELRLEIERYAGKDTPTAFLQILEERARTHLCYPDIGLWENLGSDKDHLLRTPMRPKAKEVSPDAPCHGGYFVSRKPIEEINTISHVHIIPHGGTEIPGFLREETSLLVRSEFGMAKSVLDNYDAGTTAIGIRLAKKIATDSLWEDAVIAYYPTSRLIADINRLKKPEQIPQFSYSGLPIFQPPLAPAIEELITQELIEPWMHHTKQVIARTKVVFHHHTYDPEGGGTVAYDNAPFEIRPVMQFFQRLPEKHRAVRRRGRNIIDEDLLLDLKLIALRCWLHIYEEQQTIPNDYPYRLPEIPFLSINTDSPEDDRNRQHIIYEVRKDCLVGVDRLERWVGTIGRMVETALLATTLPREV